MNWPWTNISKKLKERLEKKDDLKTFIRIDNLDDWFDEIRNRKYPWYEKVWNKIYVKTNDLAWNIYRFFNPCNKRIRKVIPNTWCDLSELTLRINFEIIKSYVEEEMDQIVWTSDEKHNEVGKWLKESYEYITKEREQLLKDFDKALEYSSENLRSLPYGERYKVPNELEALIDKKDREILIGLANYRQFLWS
jgi:hypothetical protein